jgi:hypothetical protein
VDLLPQRPLVNGDDPDLYPHETLLRPDEPVLLPMDPLVQVPTLTETSTGDRLEVLNSLLHPLPPISGAETLSVPVLDLVLDLVVPEIEKVLNSAREWPMAPISGGATSLLL